ncbi:MAG: PQQ-dependent sugar dehydrogenase [Nitrospiraceae bacterium]
MRRSVVMAVGSLCLGWLAFWWVAGIESLSAKGSSAVQQGPAIELAPIVTAGLRNPLYLTHAGDGSGRLFVVEQPGRIRIIQNDRLLETPFLEISTRVRAGGEQGLLGLAFHPAYRQNGRYVVNYNRWSDGATVLAEYQLSENPNQSRTEEKVLMVVPQPYANHNGGMVEFGQDGFLYIARGDGGSAGDPGNRSQNRQELLGKILRIDVDRGDPYAIPPDNPFASGGGRPEIFAYGLRNPWRFSFDRKTGELWAADVGQEDWEEIDLVRRGGNYGWRIMEGDHCFLPRTGCKTGGLVAPVAEYANRPPRCSITGGYVYRGSAIPDLQGIYVFGDYCSGEIFGLIEGTVRPLLSTGLKISSFGQDQAGELYVVGHEGTVHRMIGRPALGIR